MFKILSAQSYNDLQETIDFWQNQSDSYRINLEAERYRASLLEHRLNEKENIDMSANFAFTNFSLSIKSGEKNFYEIVRLSDGKFFASSGFTSETEASKKAEELAVSFPTETFLVYGPIVTVKANIPVVTQAWDNLDG